jgi:putative membrane protein
MNLIIRLLLNAIAVFALANILNGVHLDGYATAIVVALVLSILNLIVKPVLVILTLPITIVTLGLFMFVINTCIILLASNFVSGFEIPSFWTAMLFSVLLSILQSILQSFLKQDKK